MAVQACPKRAAALAHENHHWIGSTPSLRNQERTVQVSKCITSKSDEVGRHDTPGHDAHFKFPIAEKAPFDMSTEPHLQPGHMSLTCALTVLPFFVFLIVTYLLHLDPPEYSGQGRKEPDQTREVVSVLITQQQNRRGKNTREVGNATTLEDPGSHLPQAPIPASYHVASAVDSSKLRAFSVRTFATAADLLWEMHLLPEYDVPRLSSPSATYAAVVELPSVASRLSTIGAEHTRDHSEPSRTKANRK